MSIPLQVLQAIKSSVESIPGAGGVEFYRARKPDLEQVIAPYFEIRPLEEKSVEKYLAGSATQTVWEMRVGVCGGDTQNPGEIASPEWVIQRTTDLRDSILAAVLEDPELGGLASELEEESVSWLPEAFQSFDASVAVIFNVQYNHRSDDPDQQG